MIASQDGKDPLTGYISSEQCRALVTCQDEFSNITLRDFTGSERPLLPAEDWHEAHGIFQGMSCITGLTALIRTDV